MDTNSKSNFDIVYDKMKVDPKFFEQVCKDPKKAIESIGVKLTDGEEAVVSVLKNAVVKGQTPAQLQGRLSAKGGGSRGGKHGGGSS